MSRRSQSMTSVVTRRRKAGSLRRTGTITVSRIYLSPCPSLGKQPRQILLPKELVDYILLMVFDTDATPFDLLTLSTLSHSCRHLVLRRFYSDSLVQLTLKSRVRGILSLPRIYAYVRHVQTTASVVITHPRLLTSLSHLQSLSIDFSKEGIVTLCEALDCLFYPLPDPLTTVHTLEFSQLPFLDSALFRPVAISFPSVVDLHFSSADRLDYSCCWGCLSGSAPGVVHSPIPHNFSSVEDVADSSSQHDIGKHLAPLNHLERLHLGIFLTHEREFDRHVVQHSTIEINVFNQVMYTAPTPLRRFEECERCLHTLGTTIDQGEEEASGIIKGYIPSLQNITWASTST